MHSGPHFNTHSACTHQTHMHARTHRWDREHVNMIHTAQVIGPDKKAMRFSAFVDKSRWHGALQASHSHTCTRPQWWSTETRILSGKSMLVLRTHFEYWTASFLGRPTMHAESCMRSEVSFWQDCCSQHHAYEIETNLNHVETVPVWSPGKSGSHWQHGFRNSVKLT